MNDSNQCLLGLDKLQEKHLTMLRPVCLFYRMKSIFPKHIKSWLGVCAAICGVCAKKESQTLQDLAKQFISTGVFTYKDINNSQIQISDIPYTEYKFVLDNELSYIFNICKKVIRRSQLHLTDFCAVCEYPDDVPLQEIFGEEYEDDDFDDEEADSLTISHQITEPIKPESRTLTQTTAPILSPSSTPSDSSSHIQNNDNNIDLRTLQADQISNNLDYAFLIPKALVINTGEDDELRRINVNNWQDIVTQIFSFLSKEDSGIFRRYYRNSPSASIITDRSYEQDKEAEALCHTEYKFKYDCTPCQLVRAIPDIINQSMFSPEQFAIEYTSGTPEQSQDPIHTSNEDADDVQMRYFKEALGDNTKPETEDQIDCKSSDTPWWLPQNCEYVCLAPSNSIELTSSGSGVRYTDLDQTNYSKYTYTKATAVYYDGECVAQVNAWNEAYYQVFVLIQKRYPNFYGSYRKVSCLYPIEQLNTFVDAKGSIHAIAIPNTNFCIDSKKSVKQILQELKQVLRLSALDASKLYIIYEHTEKSLARQNVEPKLFTQPETDFPPQIINNEIATDDAKSTQYETNKSNYLASICQKAKKTQNLQAFVICYLINNGPQTLETILNIFNPNYNTTEKHRYRSIIYSLSSIKDWLVKDNLSILSIPDIDACLADPYVQKTLKSVDADFNDSPAPAPDSPAIILDDQTRRNIEQILAQNFQYGYSHGIRQQEKFKEAYQKTFGVPIDCEDLDAAIDSVALIIEDRAYNYDAVLKPERRDMLMRFISQCFEEGAPFIEYDALTSTEEFLPLKTAEDMRKYLEYHLKDGYTFKSKHFTTDPEPELDETLSDKLANEVLYTGDIVSLDTLTKQFPYLTQDTISSTLRNREDILEDKGTYLHTETIDLDDTDLEALSNTLNTLLDSNPVLSYNELIEDLQDSQESIADKLSMLLDASPALLQQYLTLKLGDDFSFAKAITRTEAEGEQASEASIADIMANEFAGKTRIEMSEIEDVVKRYGLIRSQPTVFRYFYESFIRISSNIFISENELDICSHISRIDHELLAQLQPTKRKYMPIADCNLNALPDIGVPWNQYLLIQYLYRFTRECRIISMTITTKFGLGGVIAKRNYNLSYDDILIDFLITQPSFPASEDDAISLLKEALLIYKHNTKVSNLYNRARAMYKEKDGQ